MNSFNNINTNLQFFQNSINSCSSTLNNEIYENIIGKKNNEMKKCDSDFNSFPSSIVRNLSPNTNTIEEIFPNSQAKQLPNVVEVEDDDEYVVTNPKKSVFMPLLYGESTIEYEYVTDEMIDIGSKILTQIACTNLSYSTYRPLVDVKPAAIDSHACPVCSKHRELMELSQYFVKSGMSDLNDIVSGQPITVGSACGNAVFEAQRTMESHIVNILKNARTNLHLRPTELVLAISYFDRLFKQHWACTTFILFRQSVRSVFVACLLIAHKMSSDAPYQNAYWAHVFNLELAALNEFERTVLILLEHQMGLVGDEGIERYQGWRCLIDRENRFW